MNGGVDEVLVFMQQQEEVEERKVCLEVEDQPRRGSPKAEVVKRRWWSRWKRCACEPHISPFLLPLF
ncbi:hypothetical protein QJS10_CPA09g00708 [Acorus calamus]|uniref:Uncharacterized protein n=1 Tax=Acorus calamus TaxID=4465 RepID=A0AAV9E5Y9_ACOCL|nr:hypothetical protein QJS10_CPA09g00708 [Acorus calamus]